MESDDTGGVRHFGGSGKSREDALRFDMKAIKYRLANDFQLAIITLMGTIALLGVSPFTLLRAVNGQWLAFGADLLILAGILGSMLRAWWSGDTHTPSLFLAYFLGVMAVAAVFILGAAGRYWFYAAIVANFFLVDRRHALAIALAGLVILVASGALGGSVIEAASFCVTVVVCALLSYAFAYRTAVQRMQLETLATKDALTGVSNRRSLLEELERAHRTFLREGRTHGLLVLDLDHFKSINDRYGHLAGDHVLIDLVRLLERHVRKEDRMFRYGGEEFVILTQHSTCDRLRSMAENLRSKIEQSIRNPEGHPVTTSIGGAVLGPDETVDEWFARADKALYATKSAGRNRVFIDPGRPG